MLKPKTEVNEKIYAEKESEKRDCLIPAHEEL